MKAPRDHFYTQADPVDSTATSVCVIRDEYAIRVFDPLGLKCCVRNISAVLSRVQRAESDGTFTNGIRATVCATVQNSDDCVVTQRVLSIRTFSKEGGWETRLSGEPVDDKLASWQIERTRGRICMTDTPGYNRMASQSFPLGFDGAFETTIRDRTDLRDSLMIRWSARTLCTTPQGCTFNGRFP